MAGGKRRGRLGQEAIIFIIAVAVFVVFSVLVPDFLSAGNVVAMVQSVSVLGILGLGMAMTILGRGIDLSMVASMSISIAWMLVQLNGGAPLAQALPLAIAFSVAVGVINGVLVAYVEIPAIFATLAMGVTVYGFGKYFLVDSDVNFLPDQWRWLADLAAARPL
ncbi:MAG: ABC transporter permease, partial [Pseudomonadota bacterium]